MVEWLGAQLCVKCVQKAVQDVQPSGFFCLFLHITLPSPSPFTHNTPTHYTYTLHHHYTTRYSLNMMMVPPPTALSTLFGECGSVWCERECVAGRVLCGWLSDMRTHQSRDVIIVCVCVCNTHQQEQHTLRF